MKRNAGFTLIELMIVVEIIGLLVAIALPNYLRTRLQTNEASAVGNLRVVRDAQLSYNNANLRYAANFDELITPTPPYLSGDWTKAKNGYLFSMVSDGSTFSLRATPEDFGHTGYHGFFVDVSGVIRYAPMADATADSPPLGSAG
jgi:type IV pilus assembly protein PilA